MKTLSKVLLGAALALSMAGCGDLMLRDLIQRKVATVSPPKVLVIIANSANPTVTARMVNTLAAYPDIASVAFVDSTSSTPTLAQLQAYDVVYMSSDYGALDMTTLSSNLALYLDGGGRVILGAWDFSNVVGDAVEGRLLTQYSPLQIGATDNATLRTLGTASSGHPIMSGVTSFSEYFRDNMALTAGATVIASWSDSVPLIAEMGHVIAFSAAMHWSSVDNVSGWTGDGWTLLHNAILYIYHKV